MMAAHPMTTPAWTLADLLDGWVKAESWAPRPVTGLALDTAAVNPGALFLACQGRRTHGLDHGAEAVRRGATAILAEPGTDRTPDRMSRHAAEWGVPVIPFAGLSAQASAIADRFFGQPSAALRVVGVTGTNGKTSVTHALAQALAGQGRCGVIGTLGHGFPGELIPGRHTTPDAVKVQELLAGLRQRGAASVAMEVSSHALDQQRVAAVRFEEAVLTNLTRDHLDYHGSMAAYGAAKRRLFGFPGLRWAVLNADDPFGAEVLAGLPESVSAALYSLRPGWEPPARCALWLRVEALVSRPRGLSLHLRAGGSAAVEAGEARLDIGWLGAFNAANLLAVLAVLCARGEPLDSAVRALAPVSPVPGRMECFGGEDSPLVVVDYAHTPDALEQTLTHLRDHGYRRLITLFGCGGERDAGKRPLMGEIAERLSDLVILTDDNPRHEAGDRIIADILRGVARPGLVRVERNRALAIRLALALAGRGDAVLVAGKGHETTQDLGDLTIRFSDRAQVMEALREWRGGHAS